MVVGGDAVICVGLLIAYTVTVQLVYTGEAREYVLYHGVCECGPV